MIQHGPWVLGSDSPRFAFYSDGLVIYATDNGQFASTSLSDAEREELLRQLELSLLGGLSEDYKLTDFTDQPETELFTGHGGHRKHISIYGIPNRASELPTALSRIYEALIKYRHPRARPWLPTIELTLWPVKGADATVPWPQSWPTLRSSGTRVIDTTHGIFYSVLLDAARLPELNALLASMRSQHAVVILEGETWTLHPRVPFPRKELWMRSSL
jgi:hypothetical protein